MVTFIKDIRDNIDTYMLTAISFAAMAMAILGIK